MRLGTRLGARLGARLGWTLGARLGTRLGARLGVRLEEGHCTLFFCHSHSHNDIGNVYLLFLSKATG